MAEPRDSSQLHARRRRTQLSRRRRLASIDLGAGLLLALVLVLATPGLAIAAIIALLVLLTCGISLLVQRRLARRSLRRHEADAAPGRGQDEDG